VARRPNFVQCKWDLKTTFEPAGYTTRSWVQLNIEEIDTEYWISGQKVTSGSNSSADQAVWIDQIELPLAEVLSSELSTAP
jgi:hypothetical protein